MSSTRPAQNTCNIDIAEERLKVFTGLTWENLIELREMMTSMRNTQQRGVTQALVVSLFKLRTGMRIKYKDKSETFTEDQLVSKEPIGQFKAWFEEACKTPQIFEPNAMFLATATKNGMPSVRAVLLKGLSTEGFKFYTNYESRKGRELAENPNAALSFYWEPLRRVVRVEGRVEKTSAEDSDRYFQSRPYSNQIGSMASKQSDVIASRQTLIVRERELTAQFPEGHVKRPACWGGYVVIPHSVEFWQGQSDRLHDRIRFRRPKPNERIDNVLVFQGDDGWVYERLSP